ncbi:sensor histidine kinase [Psychroserpens sp. SPM9]|uniref:sensor histidine kinase n=1 Tax=Psychroserpens sp. SPM9 TaxID=2975598 RepID=UPI0021A7F7ED|nr:7TM diverse intracellular signaling domain-containing protein [Psychroserpens sp. SPM9]MDG5491216.1 histidine kinase [Psychroserpens sp. SPM9]
MEEGLTSYFFNYPFQNGFLTFTIGILFILSVFHFLLYFQHKDKLYLLYSGYTFFIIFSQLHHFTEGFIYELFLPIQKVTQYPMVATELYFVIYVLFTFKFLDIKTELPKWHKWSFKVLYAIIVYCLIVVFIYVFKGNIEILLEGYFYFTIPMTLFGLVLYIPFFKSESPLKYYVIIGSLILFITSVWSILYYFKLQNNEQSIEPSYSILYIGFILENVLFSLGLGHKQKLILDDRNSSKNQLIKQLKENDELRKKIQAQLEQDVKQLSKQAEIEKLEAIKMKYDKELAELKVSALRSQMNPHFIFNSLNAIKRYIIDNEKENAVFYLNKFSKLIRKILASTTEKETSLDEELETMQLYVNIENIRFNNSIDFKIDIDDTLNLSAIKLPSLITQPFIENAIWHGLSLKEDNRKLHLNIQKSNENQLKIDIVDNGIGRQKSTEIKNKKLLKRTSLGVKLSEERLKHFSENYENSSNIYFTDLYDKNVPIGTKVTLLIPLN